MPVGTRDSSATMESSSVVRVTEKNEPCVAHAGSSACDGRPTMAYFSGRSERFRWRRDGLIGRNKSRHGLRSEMREPVAAKTFRSLVENFYVLARSGARQIAAARGNDDVSSLRMRCYSLDFGACCSW